MSPPSHQKHVATTGALLFNEAGGPLFVRIETFVQLDPSPNYPTTRIHLAQNDGDARDKFGLALTPRGARALAAALTKAADDAAAVTSETDPEGAA